jgi:hypothetical protein
MACPFFDPKEPIPWAEWPNPPWMPLGDPYAGSCTAGELEPRIRECCNAGYARGVCPSFPGGNAPDAVRFGIVRLEGGVGSIRYVAERNHYPFETGVLESDGVPADGKKLIERQADAYLRSYLRRIE